MTMILWSLSLVAALGTATLVHNHIYRSLLMEDAKWLDSWPTERDAIARFGPTTEESSCQPTEDVEQNRDLDSEIEE